MTVTDKLGVSKIAPKILNISKLQYLEMKEIFLNSRVFTLESTPVLTVLSCNPNYITVKRENQNFKTKV